MSANSLKVVYTMMAIGTASMARLFDAEAVQLGLIGLAGTIIGAVWIRRPGDSA